MDNDQGLNASVYEDISSKNLDFQKIVSSYYVIDWFDFIDTDKSETDDLSILELEDNHLQENFDFK